jgi:KUP system potassium uptake protein
MKLLGNVLEPAASPGSEPPTGKRLALLALMALGVVYGDIGTSPLYALRECFHISNHLAVTSADVLGVLSLITWSLVVVVSVKYLLYVMRADNPGGGRDPRPHGARPPRGGRGGERDHPW